LPIPSNRLFQPRSKAAGRAFAAQANVTVVAEVEHVVADVVSDRLPSSSTIRACSRSPRSIRRPTSKSTRCSTPISAARAGLVFDHTTNIDGVRDGYRATRDREAIKLMIEF
jgi:hypothetical protein